MYFAYQKYIRQKVDVDLCVSCVNDNNKDDKDKRTRKNDNRGIRAAHRNANKKDGSSLNINRNRIE